MSVRKRVRVSGEVQGVFFRDGISREAESRAVAGWVRNCDDGTVEAVFEGDVSDVDELVEYCRSGPPDAEVASVDAWEEDPEGDDSFSVR